MYYFLISILILSSHLHTVPICAHVPWQLTDRHTYVNGSHSCCTSIRLNTKTTSKLKFMQSRHSDVRVHSNGGRAKHRGRKFVILYSNSRWHICTGEVRHFVLKFSLTYLYRWSSSFCTQIPVDISVPVKFVILYSNSRWHICTDAARCIRIKWLSRFTVYTTGRYATFRAAACFDMDLSP
jgi:hypothetical protein